MTEPTPVIHRPVSRTAVVVSILAVLAVLLAGTGTVFALVFLPELQRQTANAAAAEALVQWKAVFEAYRTQTGELPAFPDGGYCLGRGFPEGTDGTPVCRDFGPDGTHYPEDANSDLMAALGTAGTLPADEPHIVGTSAGPYALFTGEKIDLITTGDGECLPPTIDVWSGGDGLHACVVSLQKSTTSNND